MEESHLLEPEKIPQKAKRKLTQAQLDQLAKAREKANAVRKQNADMKKKEKRLKELQRQVQHDELDEEIQRFEKPRSQPLDQPSPPKAKPRKAKPRKAQPEDPSSDESEDSSSPSEEEPTPPPRRKKAASRRREKQPSPLHRPSSHQHAAQHHHQHPDLSPQVDVYNHQLNRAFSSLFPNYNV